MVMKKIIFTMMLVLAFVGTSRAEPPRAENGREIFIRYCVKCHGADGSGSRYGKLHKGPVRDLRTNGLFFSDNELLVIITNHEPLWREAPPQGYVLRALSEDETKDVAAYVRTLKYVPDPKHGERLYKEKCALCHAPKGAAKGLWKAPDLDKSPMGPFEMARAIRYGIHSTLMYPRESLHSNTDIADVVGHIERLKK